MDERYASDGTTRVHVLHDHVEPRPQVTEVVAFPQLRPRGQDQQYPGFEEVGRDEESTEKMNGGLPDVS